MEVRVLHGGAFALPRRQSRSDKNEDLDKNAEPALNDEPNKQEEAAEPGRGDYSHGRGEYSQMCEVAPGKRIVMVTVNCEFVHMFQNWLGYAKPFLQSTEQLHVIAEDEDGQVALQRLLDQQDSAEPGPPFVLSGPSSGLASPGHSTLLAAPWLTPEYNKLVHRRPSHLLQFLRRNCTVLYSDIDTVWLHDPFLEIGAAGAGDLMVTDDGGAGLCSCFMQWQPTEATRAFMEQWMDACAARPDDSDQAPFNQVMLSPAGAAFEHKVLPAAKFPAGKDTDGAADPTWIHANWLAGIETKTDFLRQRGHFQEHVPVSCE